jgi:putative FmdB family regulatory protein
MPIYEFRCRGCGTKTTALVLVRDRVSEVRCQHCGGDDLVKLVSRFAMPKSDDARLDALADPTRFSDVDENDPKSVTQFMKKVGHEMGEDLGDDFDQALEQEMSDDGDTDDRSGDDE